jgi:hydroxymethylpyrimidine/phosphomethylpyrimidine kinase
VAALLSANPGLSSILDSEPFFKSGPSDPPPDLVKELVTTVLPHLTVLSATVPEAKKLLDAVGDTPVNYPQGMGDVMAMGNKLRDLGPKYIIIKREMLDEPSEEDEKARAMTTLHYVLCGGGEPKMSASRCENEQRVFGVSYSIPGK